MTGSSGTGASPSDLLLARLAEDAAARLRRGERVDIEAIAAEHPAQAARIRDVLGSVCALEDVDPSDVRTPSTPAWPERIGEYRIERELGRGGMGVVYLAIQESLDRLVALKLLPVQATLDDRFLERFRREARAAGRLQHPHIVPVFGVGQDRGVHYYAMQYVEGHPLDQVVRTLRGWTDDAPAEDDTSGGSVTSLAAGLVVRELSESGSGREERGPACPGAVPALAAVIPNATQALQADRTLYHRNVARIGLQVAEALAYAHSHGILHRDVKPGNLLLDAGGRVWITDFGLCQTADAEHLTLTQDLVGTLRYMAPEQIEGRSDVPSDVYGLGITLYELLTLAPAFRGRERAALMRRVLEATPTRPRRLVPDLPRDLEAIVLKATAKLPAERYGTAEALADDLRAFLAGLPVAARAPGALHLLRLAMRRNRIVSTTVAAALLVLLVASFLYVRGLRTAREEQQRRLYLANIAAAEASAGVDPRAALTSLEAAPEEYRAWEWDHLRATLDDSLAEGAFAEFWLAFGFAPDGRRLLGTHADRVVLFEEGIAEPPRDLGGSHAGSVWGLAVARDGARAVTCDPSGRIHLWSLEGEAELIALLESDLTPQTAAFDAAGQVVFVGFKSGLIRAYDLDLEPLYDLNGHAGWIRALEATSDDRLVSASHDRTLRVWDLRSRTATVLAGHDLGLQSMDVGPDGLRAVSGSTDGTVRIWDLREGRQLQVLRGHDDWVQSVAFSGTGRWVVSTSRDKTIRVWDPERGRLVRTLRGHGLPVEAIAFRPGSEFLVSGAWDGSLREWDVEAAGGFVYLDGHSADVWDLAFSPDGGLLASTGRDGTVRVWHAATGAARRVFLGHETPLTKVAFAPDGRRLASADGRGGLRVWDVEAHSPFATDSEGELRRRGTGSVSALAFDPGGRVLRTAVRKVGFEAWDVETAEPDSDGTFAVAGLFSATWSAAGDLAAAGLEDGRLRLFDARGGSERFSVEAHSGPVRGLSFRADGAILASGGDDGRVRFWDVRTGEPLGTLDVEPGAEVGVAFSPDGRRIVCSSPGQNVTLWDVEREELVARLRGLDLYASSPVWSPDGTRVAASSVDGRIRLWDTVPARERSRLLESERELRRTAWRRVDELLAQGRTLHELARTLGAAPGLDRDLAVARVHELLGSRRGLVDTCRRLLRAPEDPERDYRIALTVSHGLDHRNPEEDWRIRQVYGEAAYRCGILDRAARNLEAASRTSTAAGTPSVDALVFLALARAGLGQVAEAEAALRQARAAAGPSVEAAHAELLAEAERRLREARGVREED